MLDYVEVVCKSMKVIILYLASESGRNCHTHQWEHYRAVYTGIKNLSFSHIPFFCWKLLGNYP